jgi:hypothetical protein
MWQSFLIVMLLKDASSLTTGVKRVFLPLRPNLIFEVEKDSFTTSGTQDFPSSKSGSSFPTGSSETFLV